MRIRRIISVIVLLSIGGVLMGCGGGGAAGGAINPIGGTISVVDFVIPSGQTRTVTSDLIVRVTGKIHMDGTLLLDPGVSV